MRKFQIVFMIFVSMLFCVTTSSLSASADSSAFQIPKHPMIYFVMLDRFANGDPTNDSGYITGGSSKSGFDPSATGFYHGGDLAGLTSKISYIKDLGFTAIWVTPVIRQVTVSPDGSSAGYHGYWGAGFDQVDPHLGTMQDFKDFVSAAHAQGLGVILDIVANHTGDVIYSSWGTSYSDTDFSPYLTKNGKAFDAAKLAGTTKFPKLSELSPTVSFPNPPLVNNADEHIKSPAWLNNVRNYHNRGNSTFQGESSQLGDFYGLDDLFTESPVVVNGMSKIFADWIVNTDVDGFRIDTARHVNKEFWRAFLPAMRKAALAKGKTNFPMWGEVYDTNESQTSYWVKNASFNEVLDFPLQNQMLNFVNSGSTNGIVSVLNDDDVYTSAKSNANQLVTFLGNHDMGRVGSFITRGTSNKSLQLTRDTLAHALLFTIRGNPAVYYGDEFGLGGAGDQQARQDLFPTQVSQWKTDARIGGTAIGTGSSFDTTNPLQDSIRDLTALRSSDSAFGDGPQIIRYASDGVLVFSRINSQTGAEFICAFNSSSADIAKTFRTSASGATWTKSLGNGNLTQTGSDATVQLPAGTWGVFKSDSAVTSPSEVSISVDSVKFNPVDSSQYNLQARVTNGAYKQINFYRKTTKGAWTFLGADNSPLYSSAATSATKYVYRVFPLRSSFARNTTYSIKAQAVTLTDQKIDSKIVTLKIK